MRADIKLMRRRAAWVGPRTVMLLAAAVSAVVVVAVLAAPSEPPPLTINVHLDAPLMVQPAPVVVQPTPAK